MTSWVVAGLIRPGYSPVHQPISRLAELGAEHRWIVTLGMLCFALGCAGFAPVLGGRARVALTIAAVAAAGVAAFPCTTGCGAADAFTDRAHTVSAGLLYVALTATPVLHSRMPLSVATSAIAGVALSLHALDIGPGGLFQRIGLTTNDAWLVATAVTTRRSRSVR